MTTILLLTVSNIFMTFAWYGHLKHRQAPLWEVTLVSWGIAFFEYCFQVPANRIGSYEFTTAQLKIIQEVITLVVFSFFSVLYLKRATEVELSCRLCVHGVCGLLCLQTLVDTQCAGVSMMTRSWCKLLIPTAKRARSSAG